MKVGSLRPFLADRVRLRSLFYPLHSSDCLSVVEEGGLAPPTRRYTITHHYPLHSAGNFGDLQKWRLLNLTRFNQFQTDKKQNVGKEKMALGVSIGKLPKKNSVFFGRSFPNVGGWGG